jgi:UrcA family protein
MMIARTIRRAGLVSTGLAAALALSFAPPGARAQPYYDNAYDEAPPPVAYDEGPPPSVGELVIIAPRYHEERSPIGAPIETVREQRVVYTDDLDLSTRWGAHALKRRIERAARDACADLDFRYPIGDPSTGECVATATRHAMRRAEYVLGYTPPDWEYAD